MCPNLDSLENLGCADRFLRMKKIVLKYNARIGSDKLSRIQELVEKHSLKIDSIEDEKESTKWFKVVKISGNSEKLQELDKALVRFASITKKAS